MPYQTSCYYFCGIGKLLYFKLRRNKKMTTSFKRTLQMFFALIGLLTLASASFAQVATTTRIGTGTPHRRGTYTTLGATVTGVNGAPVCYEWVDFYEDSPVGFFYIGSGLTDSNGRTHIFNYQVPTDVRKSNVCIWGYYWGDGYFSSSCGNARLPIGG